MKRVVFAVLICVATLGLATSARAAPIDDAIAALKTANVYVAPGTEGTTSDTAGVLARQLFSGDHVVIVMLPASTAKESGSDLTALARRIDDAIGHGRIIGLSAGDQVAAFAPTMPAGEATDLMQRAVSVSTNTSESLVTFIRNVHDWQRRNPQAVAAQPTKKPSDFPWIPVAGGSAIALCLIIAIIALVRRALNQPPEEERIKFHSPDQVKDVLEKIMQLRPLVKDSKVQNLLRQICSDTEEYFQRNRSRGNVKADTVMLKQHLDSVREVLERYIDVQEHPRYFDNPQKELQSGYDAFDGFAINLLNSIKKDNRQELTEYRVNTDILDARRYS